MHCISDQYSTSTLLFISYSHTEKGSTSQGLAELPSSTTQVITSTRKDLKITQKSWSGQTFDFGHLLVDLNKYPHLPVQGHPVEARRPTYNSHRHFYGAQLHDTLCAAHTTNTMHKHTAYCTLQYVLHTSPTLHTSQHRVNFALCTLHQCPISKLHDTLHAAYFTHTKQD